VTSDDLSTPHLDPDEPVRLAPEELIDGYRVKRLVGAGAMGEVYLALDVQLGRRVALKFIKAGHLSASGLERFVAEARTTARFNHPNIVTVYGAGIHLARPYIALEFLDGGTLRERIAAGPIPVREVMRLGRAIAEALAEAHRNGIIHADLKPENVVVPRDGRPRVVDFGVSRLIGTGSETASGTPAYMAPERWAASPPAAPMDVWALGTLLCEALDGKRPLSDRELVQLAYDPQPVTLGPMASASPCAELLTRCLATRPEDRPAAADVATELDGLLVGRATDERRSPFRGLEPFTEADAQDFHGRAADTDAVVERLRDEGMVTILGPSGVGKSSFINAGVVPRLREVAPRLVVSCRPGRRPVTNVVAALVAQGLTANVEPLRSAHSSPGFLVRALTSLARLKQTRVVLVIDQFEEAITLGEPGETKPLLDALSAAALPDDSFRVLLALRSDFLGAFAETSIELSLASLMVLKPLSQEALQGAFLAPLRRVGYRPDRVDLAARMAKELHGQHAALPLLQFAADALWRRRDSGQRLVLTREYDAMGGATGALATHAERLALELSEEERGYTRALMLYLVNVDGTRRPRTREELLEHAGPQAASALDRLLANRLLVSGQNEETGQPLIELAHESLTSTWPALARWLAETQEARRLQHELEQAAVLWSSRGRVPAETWRGDALRDALHRVEAWKLTLSPLQREFLEAGVAEQERLRRRRQLQRVGAFAGVSVLAVAMTGAALVYREKERVAIEQQQEIRMAAADMGRFELVLKPFDWDAERMVAHSVNATSLPALQVRFHEVQKDKENEPGELVDSKYVVRGQPRVEADGALHEAIELRARPTWLEFTGRGAGKDDCQPSWLLARSVPSYAERSPGKKVTLEIPTCQASKAGTDAVPAGPFKSLNVDSKLWEEADLPAYRIDTYEVTQEAYDLYAAMSDVTGDAATYPVNYVTRNQHKLPMLMLSATMAERYCSFLGKRLISVAEWRKAARGGLWLDAERKVPNPEPRRVTPWGTLDPSKANLARRGQEERLAPVGSFPADRGPYGTYDLAGNGAEWTRDRAPASARRWAGLRMVMGGAWNQSDLTEAEVFQVDRENTQLEFYRNLMMVARCSQ
jgi:eukaryotic-like serine/threonine-protein kinase